MKVVIPLIFLGLLVFILLRVWGKSGPSSKKIKILISLVALLIILFSWYLVSFMVFMVN